MKDRTILFNTEMVQAILEGRKTQTRRVKNKYGVVGDRLWVRETWQAVSPDENRRPLEECEIFYKADGEHPGLWKDEYSEEHGPWMGWRPSIFMPRSVSRITLEITKLWIEELQEINEDDAIAEGVSNREFFIELWDSINAKRGYSWESNPFVWVIEFRVLPKADS